MSTLQNFWLFLQRITGQISNVLAALVGPQNVTSEEATQQNTQAAPIKDQTETFTFPQNLLENIAVSKSTEQDPSSDAEEMEQDELQSSSSDSWSDEQGDDLMCFLDSSSNEQGDESMSSLDSLSDELFELKRSLRQATTIEESPVQYKYNATDDGEDPKTKKTEGINLK